MGSYVPHSLLHPRFVSEISSPEQSPAAITQICSNPLTTRLSLCDLLHDGLKAVFYSHVLFRLSNVVRNELHAIVDEVYMLSVFGESVTFGSVLSLERYS